MKKPWFTAERGATVFALMAVVLSIAFAATKFFYVLVPTAPFFRIGWQALHWICPSWPDYSFFGNMSDAESDIAFYLYGPWALIVYGTSIGLWAGLGYLIGARLERRHDKKK